LDYPGAAVQLPAFVAGGDFDGANAVAEEGRRVDPEAFAERGCEVVDVDRFDLEAGGVE